MKNGGYFLPVYDLIYKNSWAQKKKKKALERTILLVCLDILPFCLFTFFGLSIVCNIDAYT